MKRIFLSIVSASISLGLVARNYEATFPVYSLAASSEVIMDEMSHSLEYNYTLTSPPPGVQSGAGFQIYLQETLAESTADEYVEVIILSYPYQGNGTGRLRLIFTANNSGNIRNLTIHAGLATHVFRQTYPTAISFTYSVNRDIVPTPNEAKTITLHGGLEGIQYGVYFNDELLESRTCQGDSLVFGPFWGNGTYRFYSSEGRWLTPTARVRWYDIFHDFDDFDQTMPSIIQVPAQGGTVSTYCIVNQDLDSLDFAVIQRIMNTDELIDGWPQKGQKINLTVTNMGQNQCRLDLSLQCPPNVKDQSRSFDTGFLVCSGTATLTFTQPSGGAIVSGGLCGTWDSSSSDGFSLCLSDSQYGVTYSLYRDGDCLAAIKEGTGGVMSFGHFYGDQSHGTYTVKASYDGIEWWLTDSISMTRPSDAIGDNFIKRTTITSSNETGAFSDIDYYNGLGYPVQNIAVAASFLGKNIVTPISYDGMMRPDSVVYLPFVSNAPTAAFISGAEQLQHGYYGGISHRPFSCRDYEAWSGGRLKSIQREGAEYQTNQKKIRIDHGIIDGSEGILRFRQTDYSDTLIRIRRCGIWGANSLLFTRTETEDGDQSWLFQDSMGKTLLSRKTTPTDTLDTYFVYDLRDSIICIIQPEGVPRVDSIFSFSSDFAKKYCFTYKYDSWGNTVESHIPGGGLVRCSFDERNRLTTYSDEMMRSEGIASYFKYDNMDRLIEMGYLYQGDSIIMQQQRFYPDFKPTGFLPIAGLVEASDTCFRFCNTLPSQETIFEVPGFLGPSSQNLFHRVRSFFYNNRGLPVQIIEEDSDGWKTRYSMKYDFNGNVIQSKETHWRTGMPEMSLLREYVYTDRGQLKYSKESVNNIHHESFFGYDQIGRIDAIQSGPMNEYYEYSLQGWLNGIYVLRDGDDLWDWSGIYRYGGQLASITKHHATDLYEHEGVTQFNYDGLGRLISASNSQYNNQGGFSEQQSYDRNGNITSIYRNNNGVVQQLSLSYDGNRLDSLMKNGNTVRYQHNANGAVSYDGNQGLFLQYNLQGLPLSITDTSGLTNTCYSYLSGGEKVSVTRADGSSVKYRGSFVYRKTPGENDKLERIMTSYGSIVSTGEDLSGNPVLANYYFLKDYNRNVVSVIDLDNNYDYIQEKVKEENEFMPFGQRVNFSWMALDTTNRYRFGGKEEQNRFGIHYTDFGARLYDSSISRWITCDPLASNYPNVSPIVYCNDNPMLFFDPGGMMWYSYEDEYGNICYTYSERKLSEEEIKEKNYTELGYTYQTGGKYYSLFGQILDYKTTGPYPSAGQIYEIIDRLIKNYCSYCIIDFSTYQGTEDIPSPFVDYSIPGVIPGTYSFIYAGIGFNSAKDGTFICVIDPRGRTVYGQRVIGDQNIIISRFPSAGPVRRKGIGGGKTAEGWSGYFILAKPRGGQNFDSLQVRFENSENANAFLKACNTIFGTQFTIR